MRGVCNCGKNYRYANYDSGNCGRRSCKIEQNPVKIDIEKNQRRIRGEIHRQNRIRDELNRTIERDQAAELGIKL